MIKSPFSNKNWRNYQQIKMTLGELRFNGQNGRSKIIRIPGGEEVSAPLVWVEDLKLLSLPRTKCGQGETEETYHRRMITSHGPVDATYFARSEDIWGLYVGIQYYRPACNSDTLDQRIPLHSPKVFGLFGKLQDDDSKVQRFIDSIRPKDATGYVQIRDISNRFMAVQYYKLRSE